MPIRTYQKPPPKPTRPFYPTWKIWDSQAWMREKLSDQRKSALSNFGGPSNVMIKIIAGHEDSPRGTILYKDRLVNHSEFAAVALSGEWRETHENTIRLPEDDSKLFEVFEEFTYSSRVEVELLEDDEEEQLKEEGKEEEKQDTKIDRLVALSTLGDKLMSTTFKEAVVDRFAKKLRHERTFFRDPHEKIYPVTMGPCGLRRLAIDMTVACWRENEMTEVEMGEHTNEFMRDVAVQALSDEWPNDPDESFLEEPETCRDHDYDEEKGEECYLRIKIWRVSAE